MVIVEISEYEDDILHALNELMPQLSSSCEPIKPQELEKIIKSDSSILLLAEENNSYYGSLTLVLFRIPSGVRAWVEDVVVSEDARGKGVGKLLVQRAIDLSNNANAKSLDLTSRSSRVAAISLYEKMGFVKRETNVYRYAST